MLLGAHVDASGRADIQTGGELLAGVAEDVHEVHETKKKTSGMLGLFDSAGILGLGNDSRESLDKIDTESRTTSSAPTSTPS